MGAVADIGGGRNGGKDLGADIGGVLGAGVVVGDDHHVGQFPGDGAHFRALAGIAVAAAAEDQMQAALGMGP